MAVTSIGENTVIACSLGKYRSGGEGYSYFLLRSVAVAACSPGFLGGRL